MSITNSIVAIYDTHEQAEHAVKPFLIGSTHVFLQAPSKRKKL
jgi:hypothetical protein